MKGLVLMAVLLTTSCVAEKDRKNCKVKNYCSTPACISVADDFLDVDPCIDPCEDFYHYACGPWMARQHLTPERQKIQFMEGRDILAKIRNKLAESVTPTDHITMVKAKKLYASCVDFDIRRDRGSITRNTFNRILRDMFGTWPLTQATQHPVAYSVEKFLRNAATIDVHPLFKFWVDPFEFEANYTAKLVIRNISFDAPVLGFPLHDYGAFSKEPEYRYLYRLIIHSIAKSLFGVGSEYVAYEEAMKIVEVEETLAKIYTNSSQTNKAKVALSKLDDDYGQLMNWRSFVKKLAALPGVGITDISDNETVYVQNLNAFNESINYFLGLSYRTQMNFIIWRTIDSLHSATINPEDKLRIVMEMYAFGSDPDPFRDEPCTKFVSEAFHLVVHRMLYDEHLPEEKMKTLTNMLNQMKTQFLAILDEYHWVDATTEQFIEDKIEEISTMANFFYETMDETILEKHYYDVSIDSNNFIGNIVAIKRHLFDKSLRRIREYTRVEDPMLPHLLVAVHAVFFHQIYYSSFLLQKPWFMDDSVMAINYASFGFFLAHEIIHAFDNIGMRFHANGTYSENSTWFGNESFPVFNERLQCFVDQYKRYYYKTAGEFVNGELTIGENLADNGAIRLAYRAFMNFTKTLTPQEAELPGVGKQYERLFFSRIAKVWCMKETKLRGLLNLQGYHSPPEIRINGAFRNSFDFARAFNCPVGSFLNPPDKCRLW